MRNVGKRLRLVGTMRGEGMLLWGKSSSRPVTYAIDLYSEGDMQSGDGDVQGDLAALVARVPVNVRLRLEDGSEVAVVLSGIEAESASVELPRVVPSQPGKKA